MTKAITNHSLLLATVLFAFTLCRCSSQPDEKTTANAVVSDESIYQLEGEWHTQNGDTLQLNTLKGKIPVVSMIFTRCGFACPRIVADMRKIEKQIPPEKRDQMVFVLISFDSDRDHPDALRAFAKKMKLDKKWLLLHGNEEEVRELSMLLDVRYKKQPDGSFAHSNGVTLLDANGSIAAHVEGLGTDPAPILNKLKEL